jgi:hypothetical protein
VRPLVAGRFGNDAGMLLASLPRLPEPTARPVLVVMSGLPGTGKSTVARALATQFPLIHLEADVLRRALFPRPTYTAAENRRLFPAVHRLIGALLDRSLPVLFDATNLAESARRRPYKLATERGAVLVVVSVVAPERMVHERLARRAGRGRDPEDRSDADWDTYLGMRKDVEPIRHDRMVIDTSRDIAPAVRKLARRLTREAREGSPTGSPQS